MTGADVAAPYDEYAEKAALGAALALPDAMKTAAGILVPDDFYLEPHRIIFRAGLGLLNEGSVADLVTVTNRLRNTGKLELVGGPVGISSLVDDVPDIGHVADYCRLVKDKAGRRKVIAEARQLIVRSQEGQPLDGALSAFRRRIGESRSNTTINPWTRTQGALWGDERGVELVPPARLIGPMVKPSLCLLHGAAGSAKTFLSLGLAVHLAAGVDFLDWEVPEPRQVVYIDGEIGRATVQRRISDLIFGHGLDEELIAGNLIVEGFDRQDTPIPWLDEPGFIGVIEKYPDVKLIIADNVRTLTRPDFDENTVEAWAGVNDTLKALRAAGVSALVNHHGNRSGGYNGSAAQETLVDLAVGIKLHSPKGAPGPVVSFNVGKNRHGVPVPANRWKLIEPAAGGLRWVDDGPAEAPETNPEEDVDKLRARILDAVLKMPKVGKKKLSVAVGGRYARFNAVLDVMVADGVICRKISGQRHQYWAPEPSPRDDEGDGGETVQGDGNRLPSPSSYLLNGDGRETVSPPTVSHCHPPLIKRGGDGTGEGDSGKQMTSTATPGAEKGVDDDVEYF